MVDGRLILAALGILVGMMTQAEAKTVGITIDLHDEKQVMHSFGASDAWTCQFVGKNWPIEKREEIADLLFSQEVDSKGNPKGIALSMWRFNIGAGSAEQGDASSIHTPWHRAECFLNADGSYDWYKQKGEQWFLEAAHSRGVPYLLGFTISAPVHLTLNGIAHSDAGRSTMNIRDGAMPSFAGFLADVAEHFHDKGLDLDYISPVNEPQWAWDSEKQEGTPASNAEVHELTSLIAKGLHDKGLPSKVMIAEAASLDYLTDATKENPRGDQIDAFWNPSSEQYLGKIQNVARVISGHSYFTTWPLSTQISKREELRDSIKRIDPKLGYWQTEFCILEANDEITHGHGRDLGMDTALYVARVIHSDLTIADATHWSWWLAVSQADYKDGLIYIEGDDPMNDGKVLPSKLLWALGNFSRFVRPGMMRVGVTYDDHRSPLDAVTSLMVSAYLDKKTRQLVIVTVNCTMQMQAVSLSGLGMKGDTFDAYTTSQTQSLRKSAIPADDIRIPPRSIVTLLGVTR